MKEFRKDVITISGFTGAGKTTISKYISDKMAYKYYSGSQIRASFYSMVDVSRAHWLGNEDVISLEMQRLYAPNKEREFDTKLDQIHAQAANSIFDVWFLPWHCSNKSKHVWLEVPFEIRLKRIANELGVPSDDKRIAASLRAKDQRAKDYAQSQYGVDMSNDRSPFSITIEFTNCIGLDDAMSVIVDER